MATEAAGEGINLQFCWLMVNFDIPWNPVRLEQRVGRIHRYGQEKDCLIFNFVAQNTREGRVLQKLLERLAEIRKELGTDQVFDVVGEVFPANLLEKLLREMYARQTDEHQIQDRIVRDVSPDRFRAITESALEGLAKKELNLSAIVGRSRRGQGTATGSRSGRAVLRRGGTGEWAASQADRQGQPHLSRRQGAQEPASRSATPRRHRFGRLGREYATDRLRQGTARKPIPRSNGSRRGIRCSRPCGPTCCSGWTTISGAARCSTTCIAPSRRCSTSSPPRSRTAGPTRSTAAVWRRDFGQRGR